MTAVGRLIKRNESVTITCQTLATETSSNFTWSKRTFANHSTLSGNNIQSWIEEEYLYGSLKLDNFDYYDCGIYSCQVNTTDRTSQEAEMPLSIEGTVCIFLILQIQHQNKMLYKFAFHTFVHGF